MYFVFHYDVTFQMQKKVVSYILLAIETVSSVIVGVISCIEGPTIIIKTISVLLLISSFIGIGYLFRCNAKISKLNIFDLIVALIVIVINREALGMVFGWELCPMI